MHELNISETYASMIAEHFREAGIAPLPPAAYGQFLSYLELLLRWNARLNLTSIREPEQIIRRHLVECAFVAGHLPENIESLLDYGSGAGLPGIPIAICRPEIKVTLAEAHGRKASFLREAIRSIGTATEVYEGRVEALPPGRLFQAISMRAVEKMDLAIPVALQHLEKYLLLLTTQTSAPAYLRLSAELEWMPAFPLPNSTQGVLSIGRRTQTK